MRTYKIFKKQEKHKKQTEWPPSIKRNRIKAVRFEVVVGGGGGGGGELPPPYPPV